MTRHAPGKTKAGADRPRGPRPPPPGAPSLERPPATRTPKTVVWVYCEGEKTEIGWLEFLSRRARSLSLQINRQGGVGVPKTVVGRARAQQRTNGANSEDEVWVCFDRDDHEVDGPVQTCRGQGIGLIFSNPCFELWPLLHLQDQSAHVERGPLQALLKKVHPHYDHGSGADVDWEKLSAAGEAAERAVSLHLRGLDAGDVHGNPTTNAWLFHTRCTDPRAASPDGTNPLLALLRKHPALEPLLLTLAAPLRSRLRAALATPP